MLDDIYMEGRLNEMDDLAFLLHFKEYEEANQDIYFGYQSPNSEELSYLRQALHLEEIAGEGSELKRISRLRNWVYKSLKSEGEQFYDKSEFNSKTWNTLTILKEMQRKPFLADCGTTALVMTEVLLAMGWKARWIQCLPMDLRFNESHCISHVWSRDYEKWIIVDAAQDLFYFNSHAVPYGLPDLRQAILNKDRLLIYSNLKKIEGQKWLQQYWVKNIFRFHCLKESCFSMFGSDVLEHYYLNPKDYNIADKVIEINGQKHIHTHVCDSGAYWEVCV